MTYFIPTVTATTQDAIVITLTTGNNFDGWQDRTKTVKFGDSYELYSSTRGWRPGFTVTGRGDDGAEVDWAWGGSGTADAGQIWKARKVN